MEKEQQKRKNICRQLACLAIHLALGAVLVIVYRMTETAVGWIS